jgi:hypothetical protein
MGMVSITGLTEADSKAIGKIIKSLDLVFIIGPMEGHLKDIGNKTICMDKEFTSGQTVENMKEAIKMIGNKDLAYIHIQMEDAIKETGIMVSNTEKESS